MGPTGETGPTGSADLPSGGTTDQALTKLSNIDSEVEWAGPHLKLSGGQMSGNITMGAGGKIQYQNEVGRKINLYADTF
jgi:hypothetical protein